MKSRAAILYEPGKPLAVETIEVDGPKQGEVLVRVAAAGVCHSDLHVAEGRLPKPLPIVLGHEGAGVVEQVGPGVEGLAAGDHVVFNIAPHCNNCYYCNLGEPHMCLSYGDMAYKGTLADGTTRWRNAAGQALHHWTAVSCWSEYVVVPVTGAVRIDREIPLDTAALVGCAVITGVGAVLRTAGVKAGESVVVIGCGGVGLNVVQGARLAGAHPIIAVDVSEEKLALARQFGATHVINAREQDAAREVHRITTYGADWAFEVIGREATIQQAWAALRYRGTAVVVGMTQPGATVTLNAWDLICEKNLKGCFYGSARTHADIPRLLELSRAGRLNLDGLVSRRLPLEQVNEALAVLRQGDGVRTILTLG